KRIPEGSQIHSLEVQLGKGAQLVRSAGAKAQLLSKEGDYAHIKLPSGEIRLVLLRCQATIGVVGNADHSNIRIGSAGRKRRMGIRPTVRGKAMNPVDHPHGGGEQANSIGLKYPKTPWGKHALGKKTRSNKSSNRLIFKDRRAK
ncbi:50S ribosomal protein L2, partial [Candidatus Saccharibacteria bacterium]|nr:50S ribosomal protein L2 [Candidatus Saccharibacteria bacterium]